MLAPYPYAWSIPQIGSALHVFAHAPRQTRCCQFGKGSRFYRAFLTLSTSFHSPSISRASTPDRTEGGIISAFHPFQHLVMSSQSCHRGQYSGLYVLVSSFRKTPEKTRVYAKQDQRRELAPASSWGRAERS